MQFLKVNHRAVGVKEFMKEWKDVNSVRQKILEMADEKYREFQLKLLPDTDRFVGVRLPGLRKLAKQIAQESGAEYLEAVLVRQPTEELFEEIMLQGMIIGYMKGDISDIFSYAERFIPKIDNWSICDSFCSGFKHTLRHKEEVWQWLKQFLTSDQEFEIRFGVVMLLNYYIDDFYIERLFPIFDSIRHEGYYVKMAVAWAISICYIKYPKETMHYLDNSQLDDFTYCKALQKIIESRCITEEERNRIRELKKKYVKGRK